MSVVGTVMTNLSGTPVDFIELDYLCLWLPREILPASHILVVVHEPMLALANPHECTQHVHTKSKPLAIHDVVQNSLASVGLWRLPP